MPAAEDECWNEETAGALIGAASVLEIAGHRLLVIILTVEIVEEGEAVLVTTRVPEEIAANIL
jgi:hypothetical protein